MGKGMGAPQEEGLPILHGGTSGPYASLLHPGGFKSRLAGSWVPRFLFLPFSPPPPPRLVSHTRSPPPHLASSSISSTPYPSSSSPLLLSAFLPLLPSVSTLVFVWDGGCLLVSLWPGNLGS